MVRRTMENVSTLTDTRAGVRTYTATPALTPAQEVTFSELLCVGGARPVTPPGLSDELATLIEDGTADALARWTSSSLWLSKSELFAVRRCEESYVTERDSERPTTMAPATGVGIVSHRAIQIAHTHPSLSPLEAVEAGLEGALLEKPFADLWANASIGVQSDLLMQMVSRVTLFFDSWPRLRPEWNARFEESLQAKVGRLTLSARPDLVLGRPKADGTQTMLLCDMKTGALQDHHIDEGQFYALVSTLRFGVAPYRSTVYSLASGTYTDPDVTANSLRDIAQKVIEGVNALVDVLTERRAPTRTAGRHCTWCPLKDACSAGIAELAQRR